MHALYAQYGPAVLGAVFTVVGFLASRFLMDKLKNSKAGQMLMRTAQEIKAVLMSTNQTFVKALRERNADGKLTEDEKKEAMALAMKELKSNLGVKGLRTLSRILGLDSVDAWLETQAEGMLAELKATGLLPGSKEYKDPEVDEDPKE